MKIALREDIAAERPKDTRRGPEVDGAIGCPQRQVQIKKPFLRQVAVAVTGS